MNMKANQNDDFYEEIAQALKEEGLSVEDPPGKRVLLLIISKRIAKRLCVSLLILTAAYFLIIAKKHFC